MGGGKSQETTTVNTPPPYVAEAYKKLIAQAEPISKTPYEAFSGGSSNEMQRAAQGRLNDLSGNTNPNFTAGADLLQSTSMTPTSDLIPSYLNPFQKAVTDATIANINETNGQQQRQVVGNAIQKGALGGSRVGVVQGELARQQALAGNATLANLNAQNYQQALTAAQTQKEQGVAQAAAFGQLGQTQNSADITNAAAQLSGGDSQYARDYSMYQAQRSYPFDTTSWLANIVEGVGSGAGGTSTSSQPQGNGMSSILGGVLSLASFLPSDERIKGEKQIVGRLFDGQPIYRYHLKDDGPTQIGLLAQQVEGKHPGAVADIGGIKHVNYQEATEDAAKRGKFAGGGAVSPYALDKTGVIGLSGQQGVVGGIPTDAGYVEPGTAAHAGGNTIPTAPAPSSGGGGSDPLAKLTNDALQKGMDKGTDKIKAGIKSLVSPSEPSTLSHEMGMGSPDPTAPAAANAGIAPIAAPTVGGAAHAGAGVAPVAAAAAPVAAAAPAAADASGGVGGLLKLFGFAQGGAVHAGLVGRQAMFGGGVPDPDFDEQTDFNDSTNTLPAPVTVGGTAAPAGNLPVGQNLYDPSPSVSPADVGRNGQVRRLPAPAPFDQSRPLPGVVLPDGPVASPIPDPDAAPVPPPAEVTPGGKFADRLPAPNLGVAAPVQADAGVVPVSAPAAKPPVQTGTLQLPVQADTAGKVKPLAPPVYVPKAPVKGFTAPEADADNPAAPVGALTPQQQARVEHGRPIVVPRVRGGAPAGAQNWVNTFQAVGMPPMQAAIMAGNVQVESAFRPDAWNRKENAHGAMQWEGDRWDEKSPTSLQYFAAHYPGGARDWRDPAVQAEFMKHEGETVPRLKPFWNQFLAAKTPQEAQEALAGFIGYKRGNDHVRLANGLAIMGDPQAAAVVAARGGVDTTGATGGGNAGVVAPAGGGGGGGLAGDRVPGASDTKTGGLFSTLFNKDGLNLTDQQRNALLAAGLGMMAGKSNNPFVNIGEGGLAGVAQLMAGKNLQREQDLAAQTIKTSAGQLGLEGQRVGIEGQRVGLEGQRTAADVAQTNVETAVKKYTRTPTIGGMMIVDNTDPTRNAFVPWSEMSTNPMALAAEKEAAGGAGAAPAAAPAGAPATVPAAPAAPAEAPYVRPDPNSTALRPEAAAAEAAVSGPAVGSAYSPEDQARLAAAFPKAGASGAPSPSPTVSAPVSGVLPSLSPALPAQMPIDGRAMAPGAAGPMLKESEDAMTDAQKEAQAAAGSRLQVDQMKRAMSDLPASGFLAQGTGLNNRLAWAKSINTALAVAGMPALIDERQVAAGEDLNKLTTRLGFTLSHTLGSDNAAAIVESAVAAVPGGANTPKGAALIIKGIEAGNIRAADRYTAMQQWVGKTGGSVLGFDQWFNKVNPPEMYGLMVAIDPRAMAEVRANPKELAAPFAQKFGKQALQVVIGGLGAQ